MAVRTALAGVTRCMMVLCCLAALSSCLGIKVRSWQADELDAAQASWVSYRWEGPALLASARRGDDIAVVDTAVRAHVDRILLDHGYRHDPERASFEVAYRLGHQAVVGLPGTVLSSRELHERIMAGPNAEYEVSSRFYTHRTLGYHEYSHLSLSILDLAAGRIVWQSVSSQLIDDPQADAEKITDGVGRAVQKMLRAFPVATR